MSNTEDRAWHRYVQDFRKNGLKKIVGSGACVAIYSGDLTDFDVKQATELGAILLLDKPLILMCVKGATIPTRLTRAADIILTDFDMDDPASEARLKDAIADITGSAS